MRPVYTISRWPIASYWAITLPHEVMAAGKAERDALGKLNQFLSTLPPANPEYAGWSDNDILGLKARDDA